MRVWLSYKLVGLRELDVSAASCLLPKTQNYQEKHNTVAWNKRHEQVRNKPGMTTGMNTTNTMTRTKACQSNVKKLELILKLISNNR